MTVRDFDFARYNRAGASELMGRLASGDTLLVQGAMGSALMSQPGAADVPPAFWNIAEPQAVRTLHALYADAGADVLVTNTFQANAPALARDNVGASVREVNDAAVRAARSAHSPYVLGSMGPCGIDYFEEDEPSFREARAAYRDQAYALLVAGADALLLETFTSIRELVPALAGAADVADGMPVLVSFAVNGEGDLLGDGLNIEAAIVWAEKHGAAAVGTNCCDVEGAEELVRRMSLAARTPVMIRPNAGVPVRTESGDLVWPVSSDAFAENVVAWRNAGAGLVGGCCGTDARTTCAMRLALDD